MSGAEVLDVGRDAIWLTIQLSLPVLLVGIAVGVGIGLLQALTQVQEATLVYAPKIIAIFVALLVFLPLMGALMGGFMRDIAGRIAGMQVGPYALPVEVYVAGLVFARVGAILMLLPGIGDAVVPPRMRLALALLLSFVLFPLAAPAVGAIPLASSAVAGAVIRELVIGLMIGGLLRLFLASLAVAGEVVSLQTTLAFAQTANPLQAMPGTTVAAFLTLLGITLIFATDLHHLFIGAIARSYTLFPPGKSVPVQDAGDMAVRAVGGAFSLGVQLAAPVIAFSLILNIAAGLVGRLMPQFQIFFVAAPLNILIGLSILALSLGVIGLVWIDRYEAYTRQFLGGAGG